MARKAGHSWSSWEQTNAPTCAEDGQEKRTCSICFAEETASLDALGHTYSSVVTAPTCTEAGYTTNTCGVCGDVTVTDTVAAKGHTWSAWIQLKSASCSAEGSRTRICACGARETESIEKLPHTNETVVTAPTCTEAGFTTNTCSVCGEASTTDPVDALGHDFADGVCSV